MNLQWTSRHPGESQFAPLIPNSGRFELAFVRHGHRTSIGPQFVSYPYHLTRPFSLDAAIPQLLTVYQQSSSGGIYRAEKLSSRYQLGERTAVHVTTQAATVVHDCQGHPAAQDVEISLEQDAFLALTPDPLVMFPGAACKSTLRASMAPGAVLMIADAFAQHDPKQRSRPFDVLASDVVVRGPGGDIRVRDSMRISGSDLASAASPIGRWRAVSNFMMVGEASRLPTKSQLDDALADVEKAVVGIAALPNSSGWGLRCLASNAVAAADVADRLLAISVQSALGNPPALRRK